jgi:hypothetical protein
MIARDLLRCTRRWGFWRDSKPFSTPQHFSQLDGVPPPAPARVTQTVRSDASRRTNEAPRLRHLFSGACAVELRGGTDAQPTLHVKRSGVAVHRGASIAGQTAIRVIWQRKMSDPLRVTCQNFATIPPVNEIKELVSENIHLVLQFPRSIEVHDLEPIIAELSAQLLDYSVFYSGTTKETVSLTVKKVIDEQIVLENAGLFLNAIRNYLEIADELTLGLARKLNYPPEAIDADWMHKIESADNNAELEGGWKYFFHGHKCRFLNSITGQTVDVSLNEYGNKDAVPDPYFLSRFIRTTEAEAGVSELVRDDFHDMRRVLDILESKGYLKSK